MSQYDKIKHDTFMTRYGTKLRVTNSFDPKEKRTKEAFKDETDVNNIVAKYRQTGQLPALAREDGRYGDFADAPTYQEALDRVLLAQSQFDALPAKVRAECGNDPAIFLEKVQDPGWALTHKLALPVSVTTPSPASPAPRHHEYGDEAPKPSKAGSKKSANDAKQ